MAKKNELESTFIEVKVYGVSKKWKVKPFYSCPAFDQLTGKYRTGQENMSPEKLAKEPFIIDPLKNIIIRDNDTLRLEKKNGEFVTSADYTKYRYMLQLPEIAKSKEDVNSQHYFYLVNKEAEAEKTVSIGKLKAKAYEYMTNVATLSDMRDILFYLGENANNFTSNLAEAYLYNKCDKEPQKVISYFEDDNNARIVFVKKCLSAKYLTRSVSNYIMFGQTICGANEIEAASFLYNDKNSVIYNQLYDQLSKIEGKN